MAKILFIVESPNKINTLRKILGPEYIIMASVGHIRSIPKKGLNIDIKNNFEPVFEVSPDRKKVIKEIKEAAESVKEILLATDKDREGEAISWHIYELFNAKCKAKCKRVTFGEITKTEVLKGVAEKRDIDMDLVHAQHARQILDRLVGYKISPILWFTVGAGTSAGRVQSIALKFVCQREKEILAFKAEDFWHIDALLQCDKGDFWGRVVTKDKDNRYMDESIALEDLAKLKTSTYAIDKIDCKERVVSASAPFDTPSMLSAATSIFKWPVKKTTALAQTLYENGLLTYIRTDSYNIAKEALDEVRGLIKTSAGDQYLPSKPNVYAKKSKAAAQEAHECIRPTHCENEGEDIIDNDEKKLYKLIRSRFIACQMTPMVLDTVVYTIKASCDKTLIAKGQTIKFDGWSKVYQYSNTKEETLPVAKQNEKLNLKDINKTKHTTQPPPRYNEASLVKKMESEGIGRPSTYSSIMEAIQKKGYIDKAKGKSGGLESTELGMRIFDYLENNFKDFFMDIGFTAGMEDQLVQIANGEIKHLDVLQKTYEILQAEIRKAREKDKDLSAKNVDATTGEKCTVCDTGFIVKRRGKFGDFFACDKYPDCKSVYIEIDGKFSKKENKEVKSTGKSCPLCKKEGRNGELMERKNKKDGSIFFGCNKYPKCKHTESPEKSDKEDKDEDLTD